MPNLKLIPLKTKELQSWCHHFQLKWSPSPGLSPGPINFYFERKPEPENEPKSGNEPEPRAELRIELGIEPKPEVEPGIEPEPEPGLYLLSGKSPCVSDRNEVQNLVCWFLEHILVMLCGDGTLYLGKVSSFYFGSVLGFHICNRVPF